LRRQSLVFLQIRDCCTNVAIPEGLCLRLWTSLLDPASNDKIIYDMHNAGGSSPALLFLMLPAYASHLIQQCYIVSCSFDTQVISMVFGMKREPTSISALGDERLHPLIASRLELRWRTLHERKSCFPHSKVVCISFSVTNVFTRPFIFH